MKSQARFDDSGGFKWWCGMVVFDWVRRGACLHSDINKRQVEEVLPPHNLVALLRVALMARVDPEQIFQSAPI